MIEAGLLQIMSDHHFNIACVICGEAVRNNLYRKNKDIKSYKIGKRIHNAKGNIVIYRIALKEREDDIDKASDNTEYQHHEKLLPIGPHKGEKPIYSKIRKPYIFVLFLFAGFCLTIHTDASFLSIASVSSGLDICISYIRRYMPFSSDISSSWVPFSAILPWSSTIITSEF